MREPMEKTHSIKVFETLGQAWELTKGCKWALWGPLLTIIAISVALMGIFFGGMALLSAYFTPVLKFIFALVCVLIGLYFSIGIFAGAIKISIERARGNPVSASMGFHSFGRFWPVLLTMICVGILAEIPQIIRLIHLHVADLPLNTKPSPSVALILAIYGILLASLLSLSNLFAVENTNSPFKAIGGSAKTIWPHWLRVIGIFLMMYVIMLALYIPLMLGAIFRHELIMILGLAFFVIAMIWVLPWLMLVQGTVYHKLHD